MSDILFSEPFPVYTESDEVTLVNFIIGEVIRILFFGIPVLIGYGILRETSKEEIQIFLETKPAN